jgi:hypothetical protein
MASNQSLPNSRRLLVLSLTALALASIAVIAVAYPSIAPIFSAPQSPQTPSQQPVSECLGGKPSGYFLIIANDNGYNNSASMNLNDTYFPVLKVVQGSTVNILFCNLSHEQTLGIAIEHYDTAGAVLQPNKATLITFRADQSGDFRMYSPIFSTVHYATQSGLLEVMAS